MDKQTDTQDVSRAIEVVIRLAVVGVLVFWAATIVAPFLSILVWATIIAVAAYPAYQKLYALLGNRSGWAAALFVILGLLLVVLPSVMMGDSLVKSVHQVKEGIDQGTLVIPPPAENVKGWPVVGERIYDFWDLAANNLQSAIERAKPQMEQLRPRLVDLATSIGKGLLQFALSIIIAGFLVAKTEPGVALVDRLFRRLAPEQGAGFAQLTEQTVRGVAMGIIGVAIIQALLAGIGFIAIGIPGAGLLALLVLMLAIIQLPVILVILPVIFWVFPHTELVPAIVFTVYAILVALLDNVLKPLLMGRGVDAPMLVVFLGAIGGFMTAGFVGLFVGAVVLVLVYQLFTAWLDNSPHNTENRSDSTVDSGS